MPSKKQYNLVQNDDYDIRIPLHSEEAFHHGITFQAKYIGMLDVPRPTSRVEIVAAMRRIRYEFKTKGIKKKKVTIEVSVDGVKVVRRKKKKKKHWSADDGKLVLLSHPIYRIFYVSHDSQDLKIFSYIARDGASNVFKCAVFKSNKKSQAMRVVRTIGQAFEVCHKLSINAPENENDHDEQETLTQDLLSDNLSDVNSDKPKKDIISEGASDKMSILPDDVSLKDGCCDKNIQHTQIEMLPPPPASNTRKSPTIFAETYASPHSDGLNSASGGSGSGSLPPAGSALSTHHELQLVREQLDQQCQQTQAAMAQLQLAREQLAAEQMARLEAQSRAHQLLVQNRELLDHIAALVAHLQGGEKSSQQNSPHVAMPQPQQQTTGQENYTEKELSSPLHQFSSYNPQGLIENRSVTSCLTGSPLLNNLPTGNIFNFPYQPPIDLLNGYPSYPFTYSQQNLPLLYSQHLLNNNNNNKFSLQNNNSPYNVRHSYPDTRIGFNNSRLSEPPQQNLFQNEQQPARISNGNRQGSMPPEMNNNREAQFIKPLSQIGTLTTTDIDGRVRVIVPVPSNSNENSASNLLANLRISDDMNKQFTGTGITRSTSEKVPNRSELMSQVQRQNWSRHTTT